MTVGRLLFEICDVTDRIPFQRAVNQNESFKGMVWNRFPKTRYVGFTQFQMGFYDVIANFNIGQKASILIFQKCGLNPGVNTMQSCDRMNESHIANAERQSAPKTKLRRKILRGKKKMKGDKLKALEPKNYGAGAF